jgi:hypothetical protein
MNIRVVHHVRILNQCIYKDDQKVFESAPMPFPQFSESAYRHFQLAYPKFHKMDELSKLGWLAADILLNNKELDEIPPYKRGVILSNQNSSLDTDSRYYNMVKTGVASPAVFVYSLPNIVIGEICIRHGIKGENTFFIADQYNIPAQVDYINNLFETGVIECCIGGWVELMNEKYDAFLYYAVKEKSGVISYPHTTETIKKLYQSK